MDFCLPLNKPWKVMNMFASYGYMLVGGFNPSEKYDLVSWDDYSRYMEKKMFQTTNQICIYMLNIYVLIT